MNQDAVAERNLELAQRIPRVVCFDALARHNVMILDPGAIGRHPVGIEYNLGRATQPARQRKFPATDSNRIGLDFFPALPKRQLERRNVDRDTYVAITRLQVSLLDPAARNLV